MHGRLGRPKYQCDTCKAAYDYNRRRSLLCGYVREEDWRPATPGWGVIQGCGLTKPTVCPGYSVGLPQVYEVANAYGWFTKGQLGDMGQLPQNVVQLVSLFNEEVIAAKDWYSDQMREKAKRDARRG